MNNQKTSIDLLKPLNLLSSEDDMTNNMIVKEVMKKYIPKEVNIDI